MIINIRGTHGSGKSTIVKQILNNHEWKAAGVGKKDRPANYEVSIPGLKKPLFVVGSYETSCGGCDGIQPYSDIWGRVDMFAQIGHVIFEGALVSSSYGNIGRASEKFGDDIVFCFMDTPVNECLRRIKQRRAERGNNKPLNPNNTVKKFRQVNNRSILQFQKAQRRIVWIDHTRAYEQVMEMINNAEG